MVRVDGQGVAAGRADKTILVSIEPNQQRTSIRRTNVDSPAREIMTRSLDHQPDPRLLHKLDRFDHMADLAGIDCVCWVPCTTTSRAELGVRNARVVVVVGRYGIGGMPGRVDPVLAKGGAGVVRIELWPGRMTDGAWRWRRDQTAANGLVELHPGVIRGPRRGVGERFAVARRIGW